MREKLIELLKDYHCHPEKTCTFDCYNCDYDEMGICDCFSKEADYLLKNAVVVLPCKVGDKVHLVSDGKCKEIEIENIHQWVSGQWKLDGWHGKGKYREGYELGIDDFGKTVFLTHEEAEKALKRSNAK